MHGVPDWQTFNVYPNHLAAHVAAGLLENEGVPALIQPLGCIPGLEIFVAVLVPRELLHRARWIHALLSPTDAELEFLATGQLPSVDSPDTNHVVDPTAV